MSEGSTESGLPAQFGRFLLVERIATGGMAEVYRAKITSSHGFEKVLVIKRILPHLAADGAFVSMFVDEANLTAQLTHQNIVQILDFGDVNGQYFIALELIDGFDALQLLRACAAKRKRIPWPLVAFMISAVLDALDYAHTARDDIEDKPLNIVHRDVSPSNVFISKRGEVKLGDFGIARAHRRESKTEAGTFKGKYGYMSPEQVTGKALDARSDLFSVGVVMAELLMGRRLFTADADLDVLLMIRDMRLDRFDKFGADVDPGLQEIVRRVLRKDPADRYQTAAEFRDALTDYLSENKLRVGPADLRAFIGELFSANPDEAAKLVQQARPANGKNGHDEGGRTVIDPHLSVAMAAMEEEQPVTPALPAPKSEPKASLNGSSKSSPKSSVVSSLNSSPKSSPKSSVVSSFNASPKSSVGSSLDAAPTSSVVRAAVNDQHTSRESYEAATVLGEGLVISDEATRIATSAIEFGSSSTDDAATTVTPDVDRLGAPRKDGPADNVGQFVSAAPNRPADTAGDLKVITPMRLLSDLAISGQSGLLVLETDRMIKEIFVVHGTPESVNTNVPSERFGEYLVAKGVLSQDDLRVALRSLPQFGGKLGDTLVGLGFLRPLDLFRLLSRQVRDRVMDLFTWTDGTFAFYRNVQNPNDSFPLGLDTFEILGAGVINMPRDRLDLRFTSSLDLFPRKTSRGRIRPEAFRIGPTPREVMSIMDGSQTLREWLRHFTESGEALTFLRSLFLLVETDLVELD